MLWSKGGVGRLRPQVTKTKKMWMFNKSQMDDG